MLEHTGVSPESRTLMHHILSVAALPVCLARLGGSVGSRTLTLTVSKTAPSASWGTEPVWSWIERRVEVSIPRAGYRSEAFKATC
jgi:hypothetical protein